MLKRERFTSPNKPPSSPVIPRTIHMLLDKDDVPSTRIWSLVILQTPVPRCCRLMEGWDSFQTDQSKYARSRIWLKGINKSTYVALEEIIYKSHDDLQYILGVIIHDAVIQKESLHVNHSCCLYHPKISHSYMREGGGQDLYAPSQHPWTWSDDKYFVVASRKTGTMQAPPRLTGIADPGFQTLPPLIPSADWE